MKHKYKLENTMILIWSYRFRCVFCDQVIPVNKALFRNAASGDPYALWRNTNYRFNSICSKRPIGETVCVESNDQGIIVTGQLFSEAIGKASADIQDFFQRVTDALS